MSAERASATSSSEHPRGERWRRQDRLLRRAEFLRCYRSGRRYDAEALALYVAPGTGAGGRFGITASRKVGKAVVRQRVRRRVREIVRRWRGREQLPALDVVVHLKNDAATLEFEDLRESLEGLLERARNGGAQGGARARGRRRGRR